MVKSTNHELYPEPIKKHMHSRQKFEMKFSIYPECHKPSDICCFIGCCKAVLLSPQCHFKNLTVTQNVFIYLALLSTRILLWYFGMLSCMHSHMCDKIPSVRTDDTRHTIIRPTVVGCIKIIVKLVCWPISGFFLCHSFLYNRCLYSEHLL